MQVAFVWIVSSSEWSGYRGHAGPGRGISWKPFIVPWAVRKVACSLSGSPRRWKRVPLPSTVLDKETNMKTCSSSLYPAPQLDGALLMYKPSSVGVKTPFCSNKLGSAVQESRSHIKVAILAKPLYFSLKRVRAGGVQPFQGKSLLSFFFLKKTRDVL